MTASHRVICIAVTALTVGFAAGCEKKTSVGFNEGKTDQTTEQAARKMDQAAADTRSQTEKAGDKMSDATITGKVKTAIIGEPGLKAMQIDVDTVNGVVTLTGTVNASEHIDHAMRVAQTVEGVKSVNNRLSIKASG